MTLFADVPALFSWRSLLPARAGRKRPQVDKPIGTEREAICARRAFLNEKMCENAGAIEGEFGMLAMMSVYPRDF